MRDLKLFVVGDLRGAALWIRRVERQMGRQFKNLSSGPGGFWAVGEMNSVVGRNSKRFAMGCIVEGIYKGLHLFIPWLFALYLV